MTSSTSTYAAWRRLAGRPGGSRLFSVGGDGTSSVLHLGSAARDADGAGPGRGPRTQVVHGLQPPAHGACDRVVQCRRGGDGNADGSDRAAQPSVDTEGDERSVSREGHHVAAGTGATGPAGFRPDHRAASSSLYRLPLPTAAAPRSCTPTSPPGSRRPATAHRTGRFRDPDARGPSNSSTSLTKRPRSLQ